MRRFMHLTENKLHFVVIADEGCTHFFKPLSTDEGAMIAFHTRTEMEDSRKAVTSCWLTGQPCIHDYDKSGDAARDAYLPLFKECNTSGDFEPLWKKLEEDHRVKWPNAANSEIDVVSA